MSNESIMRTLRQVRRRLTAVRAVESALRFALYGGMLAALLIVLRALLFSFLPAGEVHSLVLLGVVPLAFLLGGGLRLARPVTLHDAAVYLDRRAGLQERVATAYELIGANDHGPLAGLVRQQAVDVCGRFRPGMIRYAHRLGREARYLVVALMVCGAVLFVPPLRTEGYAERERTRVRNEMAARRLAQVIRPITREDLKKDKRLEGLMKQVEETMEDLRRGSAMTPEKALAALNRARTAMEKERDRNRAEKDLAEAVREAKKKETVGEAFEDTPSADRKRDDLAERIAAGQLTPEEKKALDRVGQAARRAAEEAGDRELAGSAESLRSAVAAGQGDAESVAKDLERVAKAAGNAAGRQEGEEAAERDARIAEAIEAVDQAKSLASGESSGERTASTGAGEPCPTCGGSGTGADGQPCPDCGGTGQKQGAGGDQSGTGTEPCPACEGTGQNPAGGTCEVCGGAGHVEAGGGSTNLRNPSGPGDQDEHPEVSPDSEFVRIYRSRQIEHTSKDVHADGEIGDGESVGKVTVAGGPNTDERAVLEFSESLAAAAGAAEEAIAEMPIPADKRNLVWRYFSGSE